MCIFGTRGGPCRKLSLVCALLPDGTQTAQPQHLTLPLLPSVGYRCVLRGVLYAHGGILGLRSRDYVQPLRAQRYLHRVRHLGNILHGIRRDILLRRAGEPVYHGEVTLPDTARRDRKVTLRTVGDVILRIRGRAVIRIGIDAEDREVARMSRPHPVVGIAAELAYRRGRRTHKAHVAEDIIYEEELLVAVVHLLHVGPVPLLLGLGRYILGILARSYAVGHILHAYKDAHRESRHGKLTLTRGGPETVRQIVVLDGRELLYRSVAAVVVREQEALPRDELARTAAAEQHHGILHRGPVDRIYVLGRETESLAAHILYARTDKARQPHTLVGTGCNGRQRKQKCKQYFFYYHDLTQ